MQKQLKDKTLPKPFFVLRGHNSEVQCLQFVKISLQSNTHSLMETYLLSGDADGFLILWSLGSFRPIAIWKAHAAAILAVHVEGDQIVSHGRDNKIHMWEIIDINNMDSQLPLPAVGVEASTSAPMYRLPFMMCSLDVNSLNFCQASFYTSKAPVTDQDELLVAVPGLIGNDYIDIYSLPSTHRLATRVIANPPVKGKLGNVMAVDLRYPLLCAGYENGGVALFELNLDMVDRSTQQQDGQWRCVAQWHAHRDAVLSVVLNDNAKEIYSCGIDSRLVKYNFDITVEANDTESSHKVIETRHSGQQSLRMRPDKKLLVTAGWDSYARIYNVSKLKQVAVLGFHKAAVNTVDFQEKTSQEQEGVLALGSKDSRISLWKLY